MRIARTKTDKYLQTGPCVLLYRRWQDYEFNAFTASSSVPGHARALYANASAWIRATFGKRFEMARIVTNHEDRDVWLAS